MCKILGNVQNFLEMYTIFGNVQNFWKCTQFFGFVQDICKCTQFFEMYTIFGSVCKYKTGNVKKC